MQNYARSIIISSILLPEERAFVKDWLKRLKLNEEKISILLGAVVLVLVGVLLFNYFGNVNKPAEETTSSASTEVTNQPVTSLPNQNDLPVTYIVQKGDNLWNIAQRVYGDGYKWTAILGSNENLRENAEVLNEGTEILLPRLDLTLAQATGSPQATNTPQPSVTSAQPTPTPEPTKADIASPSNTPEPNVNPQSTGTTTQAGNYEVQRGDSLWKIAEKTYGSGYKWVDIYNANKSQIQDPDLIYSGTTLNLPAGTSIASDTLPGANITHTVSQGENLWVLSVKYCNDGFTWQTIATANNLSNPRVIEPGQKLDIRCK